MKTLLACAFAVSMLATTAFGQVRYRADLDGFQEAPVAVPGTLAGGWGTFDLNTTTNRITYSVRTWGLTATMAHVHLGAPGVAGGIVFALSGGPVNFSGLSPVLTAAQLSALEAGNLYVNVHTAANPAGEIRGQLYLNPRVFGTVLDQAQETPVPLPSAATGTGNFSLNAGNTLNYSVNTAGLSGPAFAAHLHGALFGVPGGIEVNMTPGPTSWNGTSLALSLGQIEELQNKGWYANVHTALNPGGEIRGQLVPSGIPYGPPSDPPTGTITLRSTGAPTDLGGGGVFNVDITKAKPFGLGYIFVGLAPDSLMFKDEPMLVNLGTVFSTVLVPFNGVGELHGSALTPPLSGSVDLCLQVFGLDVTAPNGKFNVSNGLIIPFSHFP
ncbi:MAG: CHRD domain-containing protein [Planctomycetota bacterium]